MSAIASLFPKNSSSHRINCDSAEPVALFDASHGQANWGQTGFPSREMHTNFAGLMEILCRLGCRCVSSDKSTLPNLLTKSRLLVVPPPAGRYDALKQRWRQTDAALFSAAEISHVLSYLYNGGSLLAFAYRFGDAFTQANLADLFGALKCQLNDDAVLDISALRATHPLKNAICHDPGNVADRMGARSSGAGALAANGFPHHYAGGVRTTAGTLSRRPLFEL